MRRKARVFLCLILCCSAIALRCTGFSWRRSSHESPNKSSGAVESVSRSSSSLLDMWRRLAPAAAIRASAAFAALPLSFEPNRGQTDRRVRFLARARGYTVLLSPAEVVFAFPALPRTSHSKSSPSAITMRLVGADPGAKMAGLARLPGVTNYLLGNDPRRWRTGIPQFARMRAKRVYPGTDLIFHGRGQQLEFDFVVSPNGDHRKILLHFDDATYPRLEQSGDLVIRASSADVRLHRPVIYQQVGTTRRWVTGGFVGRGKGTFGFEIGNYDRSRPLIIDPVLTITYTSFLGGMGDDQGNGVAVDSSGNVYLGGSTSSAMTFPEAIHNTAGVGGGLHDLFFAKINTNASGAASLVYLTFVGGDADDAGGQIASDAQGDLAFFGWTTSLNFPITDQSFFQNGPTAGVVGKLNPLGTGLVFATYLDGGNGAVATQLQGGVASDAAGNVFVTTDTSSTQLPVTAGAFQQTYGGGVSDGLLAEYSSTGTLRYLSYLGVNATVSCSGIAVDAAGNAYIAGTTSSPASGSFPVKNAVQSTYGGGGTDAFVVQLNPAGGGASDLLYATFLGGTDLDQGLAIAVDAANPPNAYVTGSTRSPNFQVHGTTAAFQANLKGGKDVFLTVLALQTGGALQLAYSTFLGGAKDESGLGIAVVSEKAVYVAGKTASSDFPAPSSLQPFSGQGDVFLAKFDVTIPAAGSLVYSTFLAGTDSDEAHAVAADTAGNLYLAGTAGSSDYPLATHPSNGVQPQCINCGTATGMNDAFFTKLSENLTAAPGVAFSPTSLNFGIVALGASSNPQDVALTNSGTAALNVTSTSITGPNAADFLIQPSGSACPIGVFQLQPSQKCTLTVLFTPARGASESAAIRLIDNASGSPHSLPLSGSGSGPVAQVAPASLEFGSIPQGAASNAQTITLTNSGNAALTFSSVIVVGPNSSDFVLSGDTCPVAPATLSAGASCVVNLLFKPSAIGLRGAELDFTDNSANINGSVQKVSLGGIGTPPAPVAGVSPASHDFGPVPVGTTTLQFTITLTNTGSLSLSLSNIQLMGNPDFSFATAPSPACLLGAPSQLAPGTSCNVTTAFHPSAPMPETAQIVFTDNAGNIPGSTQTASLSGTGQAPAVSISPAAFTFPGQLVGTASASSTISLNNIGNGTLAFQTSIGGTNSGDFSEADTCGGVVNAGAICNLMITFMPKASGSRSATLILTDNNNGVANSQQTVALSGSGTDFALGPASGSTTSASVTAGQSAAFNLQVTSLDGFSGAVTLACSGAPSLATCAPSTGTLNVSGNSSVPFTVNVTTTAASLAIPRRWPGLPLAPVARFPLVPLAVLLLLLASWRNKRPRMNFAVVAPVLALALFLVTVGCGSVGGGSGGPGGPGTPPGTYTLTITGSSQGGSRTLPLSLTVR